MSDAAWKFPSLPAVLQRHYELPRVLRALRAGEPLRQEDREVLIALVEKQLTPAAEQQAADAAKKMWLDWRLAFLDMLAGDQRARRKTIAGAFPASVGITDVTVKNARARFDAETAAHRDALASSGGKDLLLATGAEYIDSLVWDYDAKQDKLLEVIQPA